MNPQVEPLFTPITVRGVTLRNRIVMSPMTRNFSPQGVPGPDVAAYYRRRAAGETGLLITEGVGIDHPAALGEAGLGESDLPHMYGAAALAGWQTVVEGVHQEGGVIFPQLWYEAPRGGHFAALEQPDLFAADLRRFRQAIAAFGRG
jgi:2,4-dienoyl-CoA reductase-like NADH-dependent reductase (Old Yellow Enzyme family)